MNDFTYLKDKEFSQRRKYIGASDVPTIALLNKKYGQTPLTLWRVMTGRDEGFEGNIRSQMGHELEAIALKTALKKFDVDNDKINRFLISRIKKRNKCENLHSWTEFKCPQNPNIVCHPDLIDIDSNRNIEAKVHGFFGGIRNDDINFGYDKDDFSANGIPSSVYLQIQTQSLCIGEPDNYVSSLIDNVPYLYGNIKSHKKTQEKILAICEKFWWHVEKDKEPKPETWKDVISLNPTIKKNNKAVIAGETCEKAEVMKARAIHLKTQRVKIEDEIEDLKTAMGLLIGENRYLENSKGEGLATQFEVTKYFLKDYKKMSKQRFNKMVKDGFISESVSRQIRF